MRKNEQIDKENIKIRNILKKYYYILTLIEPKVVPLQYTLLIIPKYIHRNYI